MRIAVTGSSGFIGRHLAASARAAGHDIDALSRADGTNYEDVTALSRRLFGADAVVHLAGLAHRRGMDFDGNVRTTRAVAAAARAAGVGRFVFVSSIGVNGNVTHGKPFTEADEPAPVEPYARSKLQAEREVQAAGMEWVIVRPPLVYGPHAPGNFGLLVRAVRHDWPLPLGAVRNQRSLIGVDALCESLLECTSSPAAANQLFLLADGEDISTPDIVRAIAKGLRRAPRLVNVPTPLVRVAAALAGRKGTAQSLCDSLQVDAAKARQVLGGFKVSSREGIARTTAEWGLHP